MVRRRGREHDQIDRLGVDLGVGQRRPCGVERQVGGDLTGRRNAALVNPRALHDPLVGCFDGLGQFAIGEHPAGQVAAAAQDDRTLHGHETVPPASRGASL
jgi:hypothetical protein